MTAPTGKHANPKDPHADSVLELTPDEAAPPDKPTIEEKVK
jgi:hypothetical protein